MGLTFPLGCSLYIWIDFRRRGGSWDYLALCSDSEEDLRGKVRRFIEECRRRDLKVIAGKSNVMV